MGGTTGTRSTVEDPWVRFTFWRSFLRGSSGIQNSRVLVLKKSSLFQKVRCHCYCHSCAFSPFTFKGFLSLVRPPCRCVSKLFLWHLWVGPGPVTIPTPHCHRSIRVKELPDILIRLIVRSFMSHRYLNSRFFLWSYDDVLLIFLWVNSLWS